MSRTLLILATLLALSNTPGVRGDEEEQTEFDVPLKAEKLGRIIFSVYGEENRFVPGEPVEIAGHTVSVREGERGEELVWVREGAEEKVLRLKDGTKPVYATLGAPAFTKTALWSSRYIAVWWKQGLGIRREETTARWPAVFPPHGAIRVPISWWDESPDPREGDPSEDWGYPIRVHVDAESSCGRPYLKDFKAVLTAAGASTPEPLQIVSDPESVVGNNPAFVKVIVLPRRPLKKNKGYTLEMSWTRGGKAFEWKSVFKTCGQRGQFRGYVGSR